MADRGWFRAVISRNPGGAMGASWYVLRHGSTIEGQRHWAAHPSATNMVASTLGLREALRAYVEAGGKGPLELFGHDQAIIARAKYRQTAGSAHVKAGSLPAIDQAHAQVWQCMDRVPGGVICTWIRKVDNRAPEVGSFPPASSQSSPRESAEVDEAVREAIDGLNGAQHVSDGELLALCLPAKDGIDRLGWYRLGELAGEVRTVSTQRPFLGDPDAPECVIAALRWVCRGLDPQLAVRKIQLTRPAFMVREVCAA